MANTDRPIPAHVARIHYRRKDGRYDGWTVYAFGDTTEDAGAYNAGPVSVAGADSYGAFYDIQLKPDAQDLGFIVHSLLTGSKDPGPDMHLAVSQHLQAWIVSGDPTIYTAQPSPAQLLSTSFSRSQAFWINRTTVAIQPDYFNSAWRYALMCSPDASLAVTPSGTLKGASSRLSLTLVAGGLSQEEQARFPQLAGYAVFHLAPETPIAQLKVMLKGQVALTAADASGALTYLTGVQLAGSLDDLFYYPGRLGLVFRRGQDKHQTRGESVRACLWAPTAQSVKLLLFEREDDNTPAQTLSMDEANGVWSTAGDRNWIGKYYLFRVLVYVPDLHQIVENVVTDPYSVDLALNGTKSRVTDLEDLTTKPDKWDTSRSPALRARNDLSIYELHIRDFSANDASVPEQYRGTYLAFTDPRTNGMQHLAKLAEAGLKAVHLLPSFHFSSVNEDKRTWQSSGDLASYPPDSDIQQARIAQVQAADAFNWGYDPVHYLAPAGAYAYNPVNRVREYRQMVLGLHAAGLRVIQDLVFNHTVASGQAANSVLDKIVPGYYYRLDADGKVESGSCCPDTASEHRMMEKLMIDAIVQSSREYKIDAFRFDLMGFHFVYNLQRIAAALSQLTLDRDGVDGSKIYLYGEGWETGETAHDALGPNASQMNLYGTGVGTFNDRVRDGIRGGGPFSDGRLQGFATGLFTDPSQFTSDNQSSSDQRNALLLQSDWIKVALAGNLREFTFTDSSGRIVKGSQVNYNGQSAGYGATPLEAINFCSVHDNQALFDAVQLKSAAQNSPAVRARRQVLALSLIALGQGIPFFMAGDDLLRSKDMDGNSFDSGDWFNRLDFSYQSNNWGIGLPIKSQNESNWPLMRPLLANPELKPSPADIAFTRDAFREFLAIRESSLLFRMTTPEEVQANLRFLNSGPEQIPGLIVMQLEANGGSYGPFERVLAAFNATAQPLTFSDNAWQAIAWQLHPAQAASSDPVMQNASFDPRAGTLHVPGLTTAVFVDARTKRN